MATEDISNSDISGCNLRRLFHHEGLGWNILTNNSISKLFLQLQNSAEWHLRESIYHHPIQAACSQNVSDKAGASWRPGSESKRQDNFNTASTSFPYILAPPWTSATAGVVISRSSHTNQTLLSSLSKDHEKLHNLCRPEVDPQRVIQKRYLHTHTHTLSLPPPPRVYLSTLVCITNWACGPKDNLQEWISSHFTVWVPGIDLRLSGLAENVIIHRVILLTLLRRILDGFLKLSLKSRAPWFCRIPS